MKVHITFYMWGDGGAVMLWLLVIRPEIGPLLFPS